MSEPAGSSDLRMLYTDSAVFPIAPVLLDRLAAASVELVRAEGHSRAELVELGEGCSGAFTFRATVDAAVLDARPEWRLVARVGTGYDRIDVAAALSRGLTVTFVPDFCDDEMAEHALMGVLALARRVPYFAHAAREHRWLDLTDVPWPGRLAGCTLGLLGFGRSAQRTAERARAFDLDVCTWTRTARPDDYERTGARPVSFEEAMGCDYVSIHLPLTPSTRGLIDAAALALAQPHAGLVNVARGAIVDTAALVDALRSGRLAGAVLDVVDPEPLPGDHPLWDLPQVLITSHTASLSVEAIHRAQEVAFDDAIAVLHGRRPAHPIPESQLSAQ